MAHLIRKQSEAFMYAAAKAIKDLRVLSVGSFFHVDTTPGAETGGFTNPSATALAVAAANASSLATSLTLAIQIDAVLRTHYADDTGHKVVDSTDPPANDGTTIVDLASAITWANDAKAKHNTHIASTTYHYNADGTNGLSSPDATDQTSLNTLLNEMKTDINAHMASAPAGDGIRLVAP